MRIVYMGTPDFAVPALEALIEAGHELVGVVTQPDRQKGRGKQVQFPPVKECALKHDIPVYQPKKVSDVSFVKVLEELAPQLIVVAAFGQLLSPQVLKVPEYGCINIHASLLPKLRGAAPIQWSILNGDSETGLTTMYMDEGLDTGDIIEQVVVPIDEEETGGSLHDKLAKEGGPLILSTIEKLQNGTLTRTKQEHDRHTYAKMLQKELGRLDFSWSAKKLSLYVRGLSPWPGTFTSFQNKTLKLWKAKAVSVGDLEGAVNLESYEKAVPGTVVYLTKKRIFVKTGEGLLAIDSLQLEGKKQMDSDAFLRGVDMKEGDILGN